MKYDKILTMLFVIIIIITNILYYPSYYILTNLTVYLIAEILTLYLNITPLICCNDIILNVDNVITLINVSPECSGFLFISCSILLIWILPNINLKHRILSLLLIPMIYITNLIRITLSLIIGINTNVEIMIYSHRTIGQIFMLICVILLNIGFLNMFGYINFKRNDNDDK